MRIRPPEPLHELARSGQLPAHQAMDRPTLEWIKEHEPFNAAAASLLAAPPVLLIPDEAWFITPRQADGNHGTLHGARVCLLAGLLADRYGMGKVKTAALMLAAAVHDCRRLNDQADPGHGSRAASWMLHHHKTLTGRFGRVLSMVDIRAASAAVRLHETDYEAFSAGQLRAYRSAEQLTDLLKAADCLDRYRLPSRRWWPDTSRLRVDVPGWMHRAAFDLVVSSEQARLDGAMAAEAIRQACRSTFAT